MAFLTCLLEFSRNPVIGGKGAIGHGKVSVRFDKWITIDPNVQSGEAIDVPIGSHYQTHLKKEEAAIISALERFE